MNVKLIKFVFDAFLALELFSAAVRCENAIHDCPQIFRRKQWGSRAPTHVTYQIFPVKYVIIGHTVSGRCATKLKCSNILLNIQNYYMNELDIDDTPFNFYVGDNGAYEGTGWHVRGAHTLNYNSNATGIAFIGDFSEQLPTDLAMESVKKLLECGVRLGELDANYILLGARQVVATESPGLELYSVIQDWDHWQATPDP